MDTDRIILPRYRTPLVLMKALIALYIIFRESVHTSTRI